MDQYQGIYSDLLRDLEAAGGEDATSSVLASYFTRLEHHWHDLAKFVAAEFKCNYRPDLDLSTSAKFLASSIWAHKQVPVLSESLDAVTGGLPKIGLSKIPPPDVMSLQLDINDAAMRQIDDVLQEGVALHDQSPVTVMAAIGGMLTGIESAQGAEASTAMEPPGVGGSMAGAGPSGPLPGALDSHVASHNPHGSTATSAAGGGGGGGGVGGVDAGVAPNSTPSTAAIASINAVPSLNLDHGTLGGDGGGGGGGDGGSVPGKGGEAVGDGGDLPDAASVPLPNLSSMPDASPSPMVANPPPPLAGIGVEPDGSIPQYPSQSTRRSFAWEARYEALKEFKTARGHVDVPRTWSGPDPNHASYNLGEWVGRQRQAKKKKKLSREREEKLLDIGFKWAVTRTPETRKKRSRVPFDDRIKALEAFKAKHGHMRVPIRFSGSGVGEANLGAWASNLRQRSRDGTSQNKLSKVPQDKRDKLTALGFIWEVETTASSWEDRIEMLKVFRTEHGHLRISRDHDGSRRGEHRLGAWVHHQRVKLKQGRLKPEHRAQLDELEFIWEVRRGRRRKVTQARADGEDDRGGGLVIPTDPMGGASADAPSSSLTNMNVYLDSHGFLNASVPSLNSQVAALNAQVPSLNSQVSPLAAQVAGLKTYPGLDGIHGVAEHSVHHVSEHAVHSIPREHAMSAHSIGVEIKPPPPMSAHPSIPVDLSHAAEAPAMPSHPSMSAVDVPHTDRAAAIPGHSMAVQLTHPKQAPGIPDHSMPVDLSQHAAAKQPARIPDHGMPPEHSMSDHASLPAGLSREPKGSLPDHSMPVEIPHSNKRPLPDHALPVEIPHSNKRPMHQHPGIQMDLPHPADPTMPSAVHGVAEHVAGVPRMPGVPELPQ